jgi:anti-sigma factor ChrR (cupin superfamily)
MELAPGAVVLPHEHDQDEECRVISGDMAFGDAELGPGDYHLAESGAFHGEIRSRRGCVCIIVAAMD